MVVVKSSDYPFIWGCPGMGIEGMSPKSSEWVIYCMRQKTFIDSHKGITFVAVLALMAYFKAWGNPTAWLYLALHGTYGWLWVLKSRTFPDKQWEASCGIWYGLYIWAGLSLYWISPIIITSQNVQTPGWLMALSVSMYTLGIFLHFASDMQKHIALAAKPGQLITDGLFTYTRNPNYLGELLIYLGFSLLAMHWLPILVIVAFIIIVWVPNIIRKERSLSRYPAFAEYKKKARLFFPFFF